MSSVRVDAPAVEQPPADAGAAAPHTTPYRRGTLLRRALVLADAVALLLAMAFSGLASFGTAWATEGNAGHEVIVLALIFPGWVLAAKIWGIYEHDGRTISHSSLDDVAPVASLLTTSLLAYVLIENIAKLGTPDYVRTLDFSLLAIVLVPAAHAAARALARSHPSYRERALIVGNDRIGRTLATRLLNHPSSGVDVVGFADSRARATAEDGPELLGTIEEVPELIRRYDVTRVVVTFPDMSSPVAVAFVRSLRDASVQVDVVPRMFDLIGPGSEVHSVTGIPLVGLSTLSLSRSSLALKRAFDLVLTVPALVVLSPLFLLIALAIRLDSRGPAFFRQTRIGLHGRPFTLVKFRTMVADADARKHEFAHLNLHLAPGGDARMFKIENDPRVTRVGRILRKYFLDELPQLLNVARGEMSLIGPRPLIAEEASHVDDWGRRRLDLKPGMSGIWQVLGRSQIGFDEMVKLDYMYTTTWSLGRDLRILLQTVPLMLRGEPPV